MLSFQCFLLPVRCRFFPPNTDITSLLWLIAVFFLAFDNQTFVNAIHQYIRLRSSIQNMTKDPDAHVNCTPQKCCPLPPRSHSSGTPAHFVQSLCFHLIFHGWKKWLFIDFEKHYTLFT